MQFKDAYEKIVQLQKKLHSEYSTFIMDENKYRTSISDFVQKYMNFFILNKNYYSWIFFMNYFLKEKKLPFETQDSLINNVCKDIKNKNNLINSLCKEEKHIPEIFSIEEYENDKSLIETIKRLAINDALTPTLNDFITYSIIPSLYGMFLENHSFNLYCNLIKNIKIYYENEEIALPLHYIFSRSLFVSPLFLKFIQKVMYTILNPFYNGRSPPNHLDLCNQMLQSFKENIAFIPSYMLKFFQEIGDTKNFLIECLFKPMIESPAQFLVVDSILTDFEHKMKDIQKLLQSIFTDEIIGQIAQLIDTNENSEKGLITQVYNDYDIIQLIYNNTVVSSFDLDLFDIINNSCEEWNSKSDNKAESKKIDLFGSLSCSNYLLYQSHFKKKHSEESQLTNNINPFTQKGDFWVYLQMLLLELPPLPSNCLNPEDTVTKESFIKMIKAFLLNDDPFKFIELNNTYMLFEKNIMNSNDDNILLSKESFDNKIQDSFDIYTEIRNCLVKFDKLKFEYVFISKAADEPIKLIRELYETILTYPIQPPPDIAQKISDVGFINEILYDPLKTRKEFQAYLELQGYNTIPIVGNMCPKIFFRRFYHQLSFSKYCMYRTDLIKFDNLIRDIFTRYISTFNQQKNSTLKQNEILNVVMHMDLFREIFSQLTKAFDSNSDPIKKLDEISNAFDKVIEFSSEHFYTSGEDYHLPLAVVVLTFINPPRFISNIIYILEYVIKSQRKSRSVISDESIGKITKFKAALSSAFEDLNIQEFDHNFIYSLSRSHHQFVDIYITGNNSDFILETFCFVIKSSDNNLPNDQELQNFAKFIKNNSGKALNYHLNFSKLVNGNHVNMFDFYFIANIYFGKNIKFTSNSRCDTKIGIYAYKYKKPVIQIMENYNPETNDFVKSKDIKNEFKVVIHEDDETQDHIEALNIPDKINATKFTQFTPELCKLLNLAYKDYSEMIGLI